MPDNRHHNSNWNCNGPIHPKLARHDPLVAVGVEVEKGGAENGRHKRGGEEGGGEEGNLLHGGAVELALPGEFGALLGHFGGLRPDHDVVGRVGERDRVEGQVDLVGETVLCGERAVPEVGHCVRVARELFLHVAADDAACLVDFASEWGEW